MNLKKHSFSVKLWLYFSFFAAVILSALWLMQIVFLQSFYEGMKTRDIERLARTLQEAYGQESFDVILDKAAYDNLILVYVTDTQGNLLYSTDEHGPGGAKLNEYMEEEFKQSGFPDIGMRADFFRPLPENYSEFLDKLLASDDGLVSYTLESRGIGGKTLICGVLLPDAALYISARIDPVGATTGILRTQLIYVTVAALVLSLVTAFFISRKFSKPVAAITEQARGLAEGSFPTEFDKGFCAELDELAETLTYASAELTKVEKLRRELIANISHDLRTPLTMIKAYTEMIRDISGNNKEKREMHLSVIAGETDRLTNLVNDILEYSAIQSGNEAVNSSNVNMSAAVHKILSRFEPIFTYEGYTFRTIIEPDQYVYADERKMEQVLYNLIGNALNYIGNDKVIVVKVINLGGWVRIEITDHGNGISEEETSLIWDRYYKAKTHTRGKSSAGLGLSIVKGILEMHEARFGVDSTVGSGSTFWFELKKQIEVIRAYT